MNFKQVEAFRAVMISRSMTTAAVLLHTSQPNISRWIALLEKELGFELFQRNGTRLTPTGDADIFYSEVERSFRGLEILKDTAVSIKKKGMGVVRVGAVGSLTQCVLPQAIKTFKSIYPDSPVLINTGSSGQVAQWVASGVCDVGFVSMVGDVAGARYELMNTNSGVGIVPAGHSLSSKELLTSEDFENEPFIALPSGSPNRAAVEDYLKDTKTLLSIETHYASTICTLVGMGLGVSIVNSFVPRALRPGRIKEIPLDRKVAFSSYSVVPEHYASGVLAGEILKCVRDAFEFLNES
jgi:DNA-binding transcriptional LysR family regulator